jgi:hypothetical protein
MVSIVSDAPTPPLATHRDTIKRAKNDQPLKLGANPEANSRIEYSRISTINGGRRPSGRRHARI